VQLNYPCTNVHTDGTERARIKIKLIKIKLIKIKLIKIKLIKFIPHGGEKNLRRLTPLLAGAPERHGSDGW
jgi:hypothetical protein